MIVAYVRWARGEDREQQTQHDLTIRDIDLLFEDVGNERSGLAQALQSLRQGDTLVVARLSQFGLSLRGMIGLAAELRGLGAHMASLREGIDTRHRDQWCWFSHMRALGEMEIDLLREPLAIETAPVPRGRKGGRKPSLTPEQVIEAQRILLVTRDNRIKVRHVAAHFNVSRTTIYKQVLSQPEPDWINLP